MASLCHPIVRTVLFHKKLRSAIKQTTFPCFCYFKKLPQPPCAVLLVYKYIILVKKYIKNKFNYKGAMLWCPKIQSSSPTTITNVYLIEERFRSQTSDNMERWKAEQEKGREKRKLRRENQEKVWKERRCICAKPEENRETLCFSHDLGLRRVEK